MKYAKALTLSLIALTAITFSTSAQVSKEGSNKLVFNINYPASAGPISYQVVDVTNSLMVASASAVDGNSGVVFDKVINTDRCYEASVKVSSWHKDLTGGTFTLSLNGKTLESKGNDTTIPRISTLQLGNCKDIE